MGIYTSILSSVTAQGTAADYERMDRYAKGLEGCAQPTPLDQDGPLPIGAHWLPSNEAFWYRTVDGKQVSEFVFVDAAKGVRKPAFDHVRLARALSTKNISADASSLPFSWITPTADGSAVRFRAGDKAWQFDSNGTLTPFLGDLSEDRLMKIEDNVPSVDGGQDTVITFVNQGNTTVALFWVDPSGSLVPYGTIEAGKSKSIGTFAGHVWRIQTVTGKIIASFRATTAESQAIIDSTSINKRLVQVDSFDDNKGHIGSSKLPEHRQAPTIRIRLADDYILSNISIRNRALNDISDFSSKFPNGNITKWYPSPVTGYSVIYDTTPEQMHPVYMVESSPKNQTQPLLRTIKEFSQEEYLKPGDKIKIDRPRLYRNLEEIVINDALFKNPWEITNMGWNADGTEYRFLYNQRGHQIMRIVGIKLDGSVRVIHEEKQKTFIDWSSKTYIFGLSRLPINNSSWFREGEAAGKDEIIWASERSGWNHLYIVDMKAGSIKPITKGEWAMRNVEHIDEESRQIWFNGFGMVPGQDYYHAHLARINFDGTGMKILTADVDATHTWQWEPSPDSSRKYFIDTYSRVDTPVKIVLRSAVTGKVIVDLEEGSLDCYKSAGWTVPERFKAPGRDGKTDIYGVIYKPSNFDPNKKYPIIEQIYSGPQDFYVPKALVLNIRQHEYAELGFIVVQIDGMGTNWRSKAFHDVCAKNLKDAGFLDRIAWMKKAQETRPWMDLSRVGVYGGSAGGQNAMGALLFHPEFYKAAAADSGCHDNRMDKIWWNEQWMGYPVDQSYLDSSNVVNAGKLEGALMLMVPELDSNVDPASTMQVVDALIRAGKDHELVFLPGQDHRAGRATRYGLRKQRDFFVRELMGVQPPKRNGKGIKQDDGYTIRGFR